MRRTKIVCTLGPATDNYQTMKKLVRAGMNVARLNMSHGSYDEHLQRIEMVKRVREELGMPVALLMDTKGPEIRIKTFAGGKVELTEGERFTLTVKDIEGDVSRVSVTYSELPRHLKKGDRVLINDGLIELCVEEVYTEDIHCTVINGGELTDRKSINLPDVEIDMPYLSEVDKEDIRFAVENDADYIALSFVSLRRGRASSEKLGYATWRRGNSTYFQDRKPSRRG